MSGHQTATINDTVFFWFAANDTSGSGGDGATPLFDVREAGAAASAIPLLSGTPSLLTHANFPAGCHEISVAATTGNGFAADDTFAVFCTLAIDSQNPTGFVGSCTLTPLAKEAALTTVDTEVGLIQADLDNGTDGLTALAALINGLDDVTSAQVLTQVNTALDTVISEITQGVPATTPTVRTALMLLYMALRNQLDITTSGADFLEVHNDAGTIISKKALTDSGGDYSEAKMITGA